MFVSPLPAASIDDQCVWISGDKSWQEPTNPVPVTKHNNNSSNRDWSHSSSQLSTEVNLSETSTLTYVYKRRIPLNPCSRIPTIVYKRKKVQRDSSKSGSVDPTKKCDSCSSSKSNLDPGSAFFRQGLDDAGECSSSSAAIMEGPDSCIPFLKQHGVLQRYDSSSTKKTTCKVWCFKACKVCDRLTEALKMLICDLCEDSFHISCCNPVIKKVPAGDWFCNSCSRKKLTKTETNSNKSPKNPIASMLRDSDPFISNARIGEDFQAQIPDWSGPLTAEISNDYHEPMEVIQSECSSSQEWGSRNISKLSCIGNWLQCRQIVNGSVCGKWRRAPLFEVQTEKWECFSCIFWDPTHADCAVQQELGTEEVLKQLKYIEMLRPRLSAKKVEMGSKQGSKKYSSEIIGGGFMYCSSR